MSCRRWWSVLCALTAVAGIVLGVLSRERDDGGLIFESALIAFEDEEYEELADQILLLREQPGFDRHVHLLQGGLLLRKGEYERALAELTLTRPEGELRRPALLWSGECLYQLGQLLEAGSLLQTLVDECPDDADAHFWLGAVYNEMGMTGAAISELERSSQIEPDDFRPQRLLGLIYYTYERYERAIIHYRCALALHSAAAQPDVVRELAHSLIRQGDFPAALDVLEETSIDAHVLALQSECYWNIGQPVRAREILDQARMLNPDEHSALLLDARMLLDSGRAEDAIERLQRILKDDPHDHVSRYQLALAYQQIGRSDESEAQLVLLSASKELHESYLELSDSANQSPGDSAVREQLAEICDQLGQHELAAQWRRAAQACREMDSDAPTDH